MSYDLFLRPADDPDGAADGAADGGPADGAADGGAEPAALRAFLKARPHYEAGGDGDGGPAAVRYAHADTGAAFALDLAGGRAGDRVAGDPTVAAFSIDLLVPTFFAETAAAELTALCQEFRLAADDPQAGTRGTFDPELFLASWTHVAGLAARHAADRGRAIPTLPAEKLAAAHAWNAGRAEWVRRTPDGGPAVPRVQLRLVPPPPGAATDAACGAAGLAARVAAGVAAPAVRTWCAWVDAGPVVLPPVDDVLLVRDALRPRRLGLFRAAEPSLCLVPRGAVVGPAGRRPGKDGRDGKAAGKPGCPGFGPAPERFPPRTRQMLEVPREAVAWFRGPPADPAPPNAVPPHAVLEAERVAAAAAKPSSSPPPAAPPA